MVEDNKTLDDNKMNCCGCAACEYICPTNAISMQVDSEGFSYPTTEHSKCIGCNKCIRQCSFKTDMQTLKYINSGNSPTCYAVLHKSPDVRWNSRSGGIFTALSDYVLSNHGVVYGAITTSELRVIHFRADNEEDRNLMRGSKYVQSDISECYSLIQNDLDDGKVVLFTGTSCQVAAVKNAMGKDYPNLYTLDIVCHGVPSPRVWKDYIAYIEKKYDAKCVEVDFRNKKKFGWPAHIETLKIRRGRKIKTVNSRFYSELYYTHLILRPCCSECPYKSINHPGDITIADYWGIKKAAPEFFDWGGVSLVLVNSESGKKMFDCVKTEINFKETKFALSMQPPLQSSFPMPNNREQFWKDYEILGIEGILKKYVGNKKDVDGIILKQRLRFILHRILGK